MRKLLRSACIGIFFGVSSALALFALLFALCAMMEAETSALQVIAALNALFLLAGYAVGAVLVLHRLVRRGRNTKNSAGAVPGPTDCVTANKSHND